jgi:hypothetical protein
MAATPYP